MTKVDYKPNQIIEEELLTQFTRHKSKKNLYIMRKYSKKVELSANRYHHKQMFPEKNKKS